jgi:hypothetical protein
MTAVPPVEAYEIAALGAWLGAPRLLNLGGCRSHATSLATPQSQ